ncbi:LAFA_0D13454g1_1 [Lachancea sp. 'fantastica']|nr:LAFA_0D13454g1_1 [Lachancea sp. 'fantastica']
MATDTIRDLRHLKSSLIGDDLAKWRFLKDPGEAMVARIIDTALGPQNKGASSNESENLRSEAFDLILMLVNLGGNEKQGLGDTYNAMVQLILSKIRFSKVDSYLTALRKAQLMNLCLENVHTSLPGLLDLHAAVRATFVRYVHERVHNRGSPFYDTIIAELLCCISRQEALEADTDVFLATYALLQKMSEKYQHQLHFRYMVAERRLDQDSQQYSLYDFAQSQRSFTKSPYGCPDPVEPRSATDVSLFCLSLNIYLDLRGAMDLSVANGANLKESKSFQLLLMSFLKSHNMALRCSALKFMADGYLHGSSDTNSVETEGLFLWLPHLCECLNYESLPWWFDAIDTLTDLVNWCNEHHPLNNPISNFLLETNLMNSIVHMLAQCLALYRRDHDTLGTMGKLIKLCAALTSFSETTRRRLFTNKALLQHAETGLDLHLQLLDCFIAQKSTVSFDLQKKDLQPLYDTECTFSWVLLLKSFSRSVTALRTFLKRNRLAELLLNLVKRTCVLSEDPQFRGSALLNGEIKIMSAALGTLSNFVVEFSNLQSHIVENGIIEVVGKILKSSLFNENANAEIGAAGRDSCPSRIQDVQKNALWVLRHLMYNSHNEEKLELISIIPMETILQFVNNSNWLVQEQCFQLLRNLTCNSRKMVNILLENFDDSENSGGLQAHSGGARSTYLFEFLAHKLKMLDPEDASQAKTLEGVLYIIVNITAINENKRQMVIDQDDILLFIKQVLSSVGGGYHRADIEVACLWILTNLIWASTTSNFLISATQPHPVSEQTASHASGSSSLLRHNAQTDDKDLSREPRRDRNDNDDQDEPMRDNVHDELSNGFSQDGEESLQEHEHEQGAEQGQVQVRRSQNEIMDDGNDDDDDDDDDDEDDDHEEEEDEDRISEDEDDEDDSSSQRALDPTVRTAFELTRPKNFGLPAKLRIFAAQRCAKLVQMGLYDVVKTSTIAGDMAVRDQAKLLLFHMDLLRRGI